LRIVGSALVAAVMGLMIASAIAKGFDGVGIALVTSIVVFGGLTVLLLRRAGAGDVRPATCKECGGLISRDAPYCKHCGGSPG